MMIFSLLLNGDVRIFLIWEYCFTYVILLNDHIFTFAQRWCENIFLMSTTLTNSNLGYRFLCVLSPNNHVWSPKMIMYILCTYIGIINFNVLIYESILKAR
jgi:hypothetical protein